MNMTLTYAQRDGDYHLVLAVERGNQTPQAYKPTDTETAVLGFMQRYATRALGDTDHAIPKDGKVQVTRRFSTDDRSLRELIAALQNDPLPVTVLPR